MALTKTVAEIIEENANGLLGKHSTWERFRLGDVAIIQNGSPFPSEHFNRDGRGMPLIRIRDVVSSATATFYNGPYEEDFIVRAGDLLIGMDGDFNCAFWNGPTALLNQRVCRIRPFSDAVDLRFISLVLPGYLEAVNWATPSITVKHLSSKTVADLELPLPSLAEQKRIVAELEQRLVEWNAGCADLNAAFALLTDLTVALRGAAFDLPPGEAPLHRLDEVAVVQSGLAKGRPADGASIEAPFIATLNVQAGWLDLSHVKTITVSAKQQARHRLEAGDVLVLEGGDADKVGRGWIWEGQVPGALHQNHVFAVRPKPALLPRYLAHYVNAGPARRYFLENARQTTNLASISKTVLNALPVPVPDLARQAEICEFLDTQLERAAVQAEQLAAVEAEAKTLKSSLLRQALAGSLVSQSAHDEPPADLLERIRAAKQERDVASKAARKLARSAKKAPDRRAPGDQPRDEIAPNASKDAA